MDMIQTIEGSVIQHGPHNSRVYIMHLGSDNIPELIRVLERLARNNRYGKIFAKIPADVWQPFAAAKYHKEAVVPGLFGGKRDGLFIAKYMQTERQTNPGVAGRHEPRQWIRENRPVSRRKDDRPKPDIASCSPADAREMSDLYRQVFETYPFPIHRSDHLIKMMGQDVFYYCVRKAGRMAAVAAAEVDMPNKNAEMTDFATLPEWRGLGCARHLLDHMEAKTRALGLKTVYTLARASSLGMNAVFHDSGYTCSGMLKNNSQICGSIQSMTVWYKHY